MLLMEDRKYLLLDWIYCVTSQAVHCSDVDSVTSATSSLRVTATLKMDEIKYEVQVCSVD